MSEDVLWRDEIRLYLRALALQAVREQAVRLLTHKNHFAIYNALDGKTKQAEVASKAGVSPATVSNTVKIFINAGLVAPATNTAAPRALFSTDELGVDPPATKA